MDIGTLESPCFLMDERKLRSNLGVIRDVSRRAGVEIIVALKANAMWSVFPVMKEYVSGATASSLAEAILVVDKFKSLCHTYAPVYKESEIGSLLECSSHITFNSLSQYHRFGPMAIEGGVSCGLRINPGWSPVGTDLYNPASPGSRLGIPASELKVLPDGIDGLHFHNLCESRSEDLGTTLDYVEREFGHLLPHLHWVNMGGGHLMTADWYDRELLIEVLRGFRNRYPNLRVILEPGSAFTWRTGVLVTTIEDIVVNAGTTTLMIDASFACHMPDCLEMPYKPAISGAHEPVDGEKRYRVGGNSCLAGDFVGDWAFDKEPMVGDRLVLEDMMHYTMVKTTMFNGVSHPSIAVRDMEDNIQVVKRFGYGDYRDRMS